jgi:hypothetical protein
MGWRGGVAWKLEAISECSRRLVNIGCERQARKYSARKLQNSTMQVLTVAALCAGLSQSRDRKGAEGYYGFNGGGFSGCCGAL